MRYILLLIVAAIFVIGLVSVFGESQTGALFFFGAPIFLKKGIDIF